MKRFNISKKITKIVKSKLTIKLGNAILLLCKMLCSLWPIFRTQVNRLIKIYELIEKSEHLKFLKSKINIRLLVSALALYWLLKFTFVDLFFNKIKKEMSSDVIVERLNSAIREGKETASIAERLIKSFNIDGVKLSDIKSDNKRIPSGFIVLRKDHLNLDALNYNIIPTCGSRIKANIVGKDIKGNEFINDDFEFNFSSGQLPFGLDLGFQRISSGFEHDIIASSAYSFFGDIDMAYDISLKNLLQPKGKFATFSTKILNIDKGFDVGFYDPKIFYELRGDGIEITCNSNVNMDIKIKNLDNTIVSDFSGSISVGSDQLPKGIEFLLLRLKSGDKVTIIADETWAGFVNQKSQIKKYYLVEITVKDIRHPYWTMRSETELMSRFSNGSRTINTEEYEQLQNYKTIFEQSKSVAK